MRSPRRHASTARIARAVARVALFVGLLAVAPATANASTAPESNGSSDAVSGRPLVELLEQFQDEGLRLVFSNAVVTESMRVEIEPGPGSPRERLERILESLGLRATDGPGGSLLIVRAGSPRGTLSGRVVTLSGRSPIATATVRLQSTGVTVAVGPDGSFRIAGVPAGLHRLGIEALGFESAVMSHIRVRDRQTNEVEIALRAQLPFVTEVVVTPGRYSLIREPPSTVRTVSGEEAVLAPAIGGDVSRAIERLPGVTAQDSSAAFNVRGSAANDVSIVLDGLELYDPFHLQSFHSPFSLIDTNVVDRIDVLGGGFTAERGDRHGGFVEISTLAPETLARGELELGTLNSRLSYRGVTGSGGAWLVSARTWYPEAIRPSTELGQGEKLDPRFADLYGKVGFSVARRHRVSAHSLLSYDRLRFDETGETVNEQVDAVTRNAFVWLRARSAWLSSLSSESIVSLGRIERLRDGISSEDGAIDVDDDRTVRFVGLRHDLRWRASDRHLFKIGFDVRRLDARYRYSADVTDDPGESVSLSLDPSGTSLGVYAAHRAQLSPRVVLELGARWDRQTYTNDNQLGPRLNAVWTITERSELRAALGRFNQSQRIHELAVEDGETAFGRAEASEQAELSYRQRLTGGLMFRIDLYDHRIDQLRARYENLFEPIELFPETIGDRVRLAPDEARLRGAEFLLRGREERPVFWWVGYTWSSAEDRIDGDWVPRGWDQPHAATFLVGYRDGRRWSLAASGSWRSGWPTTPAEAVTVTRPDGSTEFDVVPAARHSDRFPTYFRLEVRAERTIELRRGRLRLSFEVVNLTDRDNPCCVNELEIVPRGDGGADVRRLFDGWLGATPSFSAAWEF